MEGRGHCSQAIALAAVLRRSRTRHPLSSGRKRPETAAKFDSEPCRAGKEPIPKSFGDTSAVVDSALRSLARHLMTALIHIFA